MNQRERMRQRRSTQGLWESRIADAARWRSIEFNINELVLRGVDAGERQRIKDAVQSELTRLLTEQGLPVDLTKASRERLDGGAISLNRNLAAATTGGRIAEAVYRGITNAESSECRPDLATRRIRANHWNRN